MTQAHAENRHLACERFDHSQGYAGIARHARTRRDTQVRGLERARLLDGDLVVAIHHDLGAEHHEGLHQVVGERVVVINEQQSGWAHKPSCASASARRTISLLASTSRYSVSGTLSATSPAPAWKL